MYITGTHIDYESRFHELCTNNTDLNNFLIEGSGYINNPKLKNSISQQMIGKWEKEGRKVTEKITQNHLSPTIIIFTPQW